MPEHFCVVVHEMYARLANTLSVTDLSFDNSGYVSQARLSGFWGHINLLLGPPEYHVELFIVLSGDGGRECKYDLAALMGMSEVKAWILASDNFASIVDQVEADVLWIEQILSQGLRKSPKFNLIYK